MKLLVFCFILPLANSNQINFANLGSVRIVDGYLHIQSGFPLDSLHENKRIIVPQIHKVTKCDIVILHLCFVLKVQQNFHYCLISRLSSPCLPLIANKQWSTNSSITTLSSNLSTVNPASTKPRTPFLTMVDQNEIYSRASWLEYHLESGCTICMR